MSTENGKKKPQGFAAMPNDVHRDVSAKGGSAKVPKGTAVMDEAKRSENASKAARIRWDRVKANRQKEEQDGTEEASV